MDDQIILEIINLKKTFGGIVAVDELNLAVHKNSITSIIGPNGAGKTTIFNLITGFLEPTSGKINFSGENIACLKPYITASKGIARTFQHVELFSNMSILENIMVGRHLRSSSNLLQSFFIPPYLRKEEKLIRQEALKWLSFVGLEEHQNKKAGSLPLGNQRVLEIARALSMEPKLILLDEPASGLNSRETVVMGELIKQINELDVTVILVEHDMEIVMDISDKVAVINFGKCIAKGIPSDIQVNKEVIDAYLGE